ncbi:hypothetical protein CLOM_g14876 [Closterium sp. NIES-68]|nr:hypothetical protein CLOM_g14876 [Closterium sp. NIES-68]GJP75564.1 hypothetical protein CLOP_g5996 [Closterium sp. NIES-67]
MRTSVLLSALVLLAALLVAADRVSAIENSRRALGDDSCLEKFKESAKKCKRDHDPSDKIDRCRAKAYKRFKVCKYGAKKPPTPPPSLACKDLCMMIYMQCKDENRGNCGWKYNNCLTNDCS